MRRSIFSLIVLLAGISLHASARATDVDGPDCGRPISDFGDAPEGLPIFGAFGPIGHYPTCLLPGAPGNQTFDCPPISAPPGPTGYMHNFQPGEGNYWLGCYVTPTGMAGIDSEDDGKVSFPFGPSFCSGIPTDCAASFYPLGQDECGPYDGDAGLRSDLLIPCYPNQIYFQTANCGPPRPVYLNVLVDYNFDGDWNDNMLCSSPGSGSPACAYEWSVKNAVIFLANGCEDQTSPTFLAGPQEGLAWMRISLTDDPMADDFPWAGSANQPEGFYTGGETEDYQIRVLNGLPTKKSSWGQVKTLYR